MSKRFKPLPNLPEMKIAILSKAKNLAFSAV